MKQLYCLILFIAGVFSLTQHAAAQHFWQKMNAPIDSTVYPDNVESFITTANGTVLAGTAETGVYATADHGAHWAAAFGGLFFATPYQSIGVFAKGDSGILYTGYSYTSGNGTLYLFYRSIDNGMNWRLMTNLNISVINALVTTKSGIVYIATDNGVLCSTDNGFTWQQPTTTNYAHLIVDQSGKLYAATTSGALYLSSDSGIAWTVFSNYTRVRSIFAAANGAIIQSCFRGMFRTTNNGTSWDSLLIPNGNTVFGELSNIIFLGSVGGNTPAYRSTDYGKTWDSVQIAATDPGVLAFNTDSAGYVYAATTDNNCYVSADSGKTWHPMVKGLFQPNSGASIGSVACDKSGTLYAVEYDSINGTEFSSIYKSLDNAVTWSHITLFTNDDILTILPTSKGLFLGTRDSGIFLSTNDGVSWTAMNTGLYTPYIYTLFADTQGNLYAGTVNSGAYRSSDNGSHWNAINSGLTNGGSVPFIFAFTQSTNAIYAQTDSAIYRTTNGGAQWEKTYFSGGYAITSDGASTIYAGGFGYLNRSTNDGETWSALPIILDNPNYGEQVNALVRDWRGYLYAEIYNNGTYTLSRSLDSGKTWSWINDSVTDAVFSLAAGNRYVFAGSASGVYRADSNAIVTWKPTTPSLAFRTGSINHVSNIEFWQENYGPMFYNLNSSTTSLEGMFWPRGSNFDYCFGGGFWFGSQSKGAQRVVVAYDPRTGNSWFQPGSVQSAQAFYDTTQKTGFPSWPSLLDTAYCEKFTILYSTQYNRMTGMPLDPSTHLPPWPIWDTNPDTNALPGLNHYWGNYVDDISQRNLTAYPAHYVIKITTFFDSTLNKMVTDTAVYQKGGPVFISDEDMFTVSNNLDTSWYSGPSYPRSSYPAIEAQRTIYSWAAGPAQNLLCIVIKIINKSATELDSCWYAPIMDYDIGVADLNDCGFYNSDTSLNLGLGWSGKQVGVPYSNQESAYPGVEGWDFLQSPALYKSGDDSLDANGIDTHVPASVNLIGSIKPGVFPTSQQLGLVRFNRWSLTYDPPNDAAKYVFMTGNQRDTSPNNASWSDYRILMSTGPFKLLPGQAAQVVVGFMIARDSVHGDNNLQSSKDSCVRLARQMQAFYENGFKTIPPVPPVGVAEQKSNNGTLPVSPFMNAYPNPATRLANISFTISDIAPVTIRLFDMQGNMVKEIAHAQYMMPGDHTISFDASGLPSSAYQCVLSTPSAMAHQLVTINR